MRVISLALLLTMAFGFTNKNGNSDAIAGKWMSAENNLEVEVYRAGDSYKARVVWFDDTDNKGRPMDVRQDTKNPDKTLRSRKIIGLIVMYGLTYNADDEEWQGHP